MIKNNVTRLLDSKKIKYKAFELSGEKLSALEAAQVLNIPPEEVYKSIVILRNKPKKPVLAVVSAESEADLKLIAAALGEKKVSLATQNEAEQLTGLLSGGISPLALINKGFTILLDEKALLLEELNVSGGQRELNVRLPVNDFLKLTGARTAPISKGLQEI